MGPISIFIKMSNDNSIGRTIPEPMHKHIIVKEGNIDAVEDSIIKDGLWDVFNDQHMGNCAELCAREKNYTRREQDEFAEQSYSRAINACL